MKVFITQWISGLVPAVGLQKHLIFVGFCLVLLVLGLLPENQLLPLQFESGQALSYRWFSAHFVHLGFTHAIMNIAGAVILWLLVVAYLPLQILFALILCLPFVISAGLYFDVQMIGGYRGFSGAIYGFYAAGVIWHWWINRVFAVLVGVFLLGKIFIEQMPNFDNTYLLETIGGLVAVDSHLYGVIGGVVITIAFILGASLGLVNCPKPWAKANS